MPKKIFISYAREDLETAEKLHADLKSDEFDPWLDENDLLAGENWRQTIPRLIRETDYVVVLLSARSVSKRGFFQAEQKRALEALDEVPESDIFLIPVRLDDCEIPDRLADYNRVDLFENYESGLNKIIKSLEFEKPKPSPPKTPKTETPLVYVSYAPIDNEQGWVTTFKTNLESEIAQRIGNRDDFELFMDKDADETISVLPEPIVERIENTAVFIAIVSPGYLASQRRQGRRGRH